MKYYSKEEKDIKNIYLWTEGDQKSYLETIKDKLKNFTEDKG